MPEFPVSECCKLANNRGYVSFAHYGGCLEATLQLLCLHLLCSRDHHYAGRFRLRGNLHKAVLCTHHGMCTSVCVCVGGGGEEAEGLL